MAGVSPDGRRFRYSHANSSVDLIAGNLQVTATTVGANHTNLAVGKAAADDARIVTDITIGATALTLNQYRDGYLTIQDGTGKGHTYQIDGHNAYDASATNVKIVLRDRLIVALDATSEVTLAYNPNDLAVISATDQNDVPTGITHVAVDVSAARYYWAQTGGVAPVFSETTNPVGDEITISASTNGEVEVRDADTEPTVGVQYEVGVDSEVQLALLSID